jgi:hypothetical protein
MRLLWRVVRLATIIMLLGGTAAFAAAASPAASAASAPEGWVRIAHLSPRAPAMDMYLYPFGEPGRATVLRDVGYGNVSAYMALSPGQYTVAIRGFGAPAGKALVRVLQASLKENLVTVSYGSDVLARQLGFGSATSYAAVSPGEQTVQFTAAAEHAAMPVQFPAGTVHTIVVLDDSPGLTVDALTDAAGSQIMPKGGAATGSGGTAARPAPDPAPWLLTIAAGALLAAAGLVGLRRAAQRPSPT